MFHTTVTRHVRRPHTFGSTTSFARAEGLEPRMLLATFVVNNTGDSGPGTLRQAIVDANAATTTDTIRFDVPGAGVQTIAPLSALPFAEAGLTIDGATQRGYGGTPLIELSGAGAGPSADGLVLGTNSTVKALTINRFAGNGVILLSQFVAVSGCYIGTDASGAAAEGNGGDGISYVAGPPLDNIRPAITGNVISGNRRNGVRLVNGGSVISGNVIGLNAAGTARLGNGADGVQIIGGGAQIAPASGSPTVRNVISGNGGSGVHVIDANVTLLNSYIGTDVSGNAPIGNDGHGVFFEGASGSIGSTVRTGTGAGNLISGNRGDGIHVVGGATEGSQPTLSIQSNKIGTNAAGDPSDATMGNAGDGVSLFNVGGGQIGGEEDISPNTIAFNAGSGVSVAGVDSTRVRVERNGIFSNGGLGIDLKGGNDASNGVTPNDPGDADHGPNTLLNVPVIRAAEPSAGTGTTVRFSLDAPRARTYRVEFFASPAPDPTGFGEGRTFLGFTTLTLPANTNANIGSATLPAVPLGTFITATATDQLGRMTSEFSAAVAVAEARPAQVAARHLVVDRAVQDTQALLPGQTATFANVTNDARGILRVAVDFIGLAHPETLTAADFTFRTGNTDDPASWIGTPIPTQVLVEADPTPGGDRTRVTALFAPSAIRNRWLRVTAKANERTGLAKPDVFYFGSLVGETGDPATPLRVTSLDLAAVKRAMSGPTPSTDPRYDFDRNGVVNALDLSAVRQNLFRTLPPLVAPLA